MRPKCGRVPHPSGLRVRVFSSLTGPPAAAGGRYKGFPQREERGTAGLRYNFRLMPSILCRGLLIDMDGVLVDSTAAIARVWARWAARHNMDPVAVTALAHGRTSLNSIKDLLPHETPEVHLEENLWMLQAEIEDVADVVALPGARGLLASVPSDRRAVVTSAARSLAEVRLRAAGVWDLV